jgi:hypothetical protein
MRLYELAKRIGARILNYSGPFNVEIERFYADDKISELLAEKSCDTTLVVSNILNPHIFKVAGLLEVPAICLLSNYMPEQELLNASTENGTILMVSPVGLDETMDRLYTSLGPSARIKHASRS